MGACRRQTGTTVQDDGHLPREAPPLARRDAHARCLNSILPVASRSLYALTSRIGRLASIAKEQSQSRFVPNFVDLFFAVNSRRNSAQIASTGVHSDFGGPRHLPWFDLYDAELKAINGSGELAGLDSVAAKGIKKGEAPLPENDPLSEMEVNLLSGISKLVRVGSF